MADIADYLGEAAINGHAVPDWLDHLASMEQGAAKLFAYEATTVHGLLQTSAYASAVESVGPDRITTTEVKRRVEKRLARQGVLSRKPDPLMLSVILDESILHRRAGDPEVMADQLDRVTEAAKLPNVELQILPFDAGMFVFGSFWLFTSAGVDLPYMAVVEDRTGPNYIDRPHDLEAHVTFFEHLTGVALSPAESIDLVRIAAKEYRHG